MTAAVTSPIAIYGRHSIDRTRPASRPHCAKLLVRLALEYQVPRSPHIGRHYVGHLGRFAIPAAAIVAGGDGR